MPYDVILGEIEEPQEGVSQFRSIVVFFVERLIYSQKSAREIGYAFLRFLGKLGMTFGGILNKREVDIY